MSQSLSISAVLHSDKRHYPGIYLSPANPKTSHLYDFSVPLTWWLPKRRHCLSLHRDCYYVNQSGQVKQWIKKPKCWDAESNLWELSMVFCGLLACTHPWPSDLYRPHSHDCPPHFFWTISRKNEWADWTVSEPDASDGISSCLLILTLGLRPHSGFYFLTSRFR